MVRRGMYFFTINQYVRNSFRLVEQLCAITGQKMLRSMYILYKTVDIAGERSLTTY